MKALLADTQYALVYTTNMCCNVRLTTTVNMLQWRLKNMLHRPTSIELTHSLFNSFTTVCFPGKQTVVKLLNIVTIALATIVIVNKHYCSALDIIRMLNMSNVSRYVHMYGLCDNQIVMLHYLQFLLQIKWDQNYLCMIGKLFSLFSTVFYGNNCFPDQEILCLLLFAQFCPVCVTLPLQPLQYHRKEWGKYKDRS